MKTQRRPTSRDATYAASWAASWSPGEYQVPPFKNVYSVAFDGTDDYAQTNAVTTRASKTYSFWAKSSDTARNDVFWHGAGDIGFFGFNFSGGRSVLYLGTGYFRYWDSTDERADGNWHNWIVYIDSTISGSKLYLDGSEVGVNYTLDSGSAKAYTSGLRIGASNYDGNIDEFAVFDGDKTSLASTIYNDGVPADLTGLDGLEHWWRMGDGTQPASDGTNNLVFDQADKTLGSEVLTGFTNGSTYPFDTFASSGTFISSAIETSGNWGGCASNSFSITSGEIYKVTFDLTYNSGTDTLRVVLADSANGAATQRCAPYYTDTNGLNTVYVKATATDSTAHLQLGTWHSSDLINFSASNISVKKVNGAAATLTNGAAIEVGAPS